MTAFLVNQTKSYTLAVSKETGEIRFELSDELKENLTEMVTEADTNADVFAGVLDLMGEDAGAYLAAMGELIGAGDTLADAYAIGGTGAFLEMVAGMTNDAFESGAGLVERANAGNGFDNFKEIAGSTLAEMMDFGQPSFDPFAEPGSEEGKAAIEAAIGAEETMALPGWVVPAGIILVVGAVGYYAATKYEEKMKKEVNKIPADPNDPGFDMAEWLERPWAEESLDPTFGETMPSDPSTDPNEGGVEGPTKEFDPEEELEREILRDLEAEEVTYTAEQIQEAAEFHLTTTTTPAEEFKFKPGFGKEPDLGGGEDFQEGAEGIIYITHGDGGIIANPMAAVVEPAPAETQVEEPTPTVDHFDFM